MEMGYEGPNLPFSEATGPVAGTDYPDYVTHPEYYTRNIDYFATKKIAVFRLLFSWEGMQSSLMGTIPAATTGNYKTYFDTYKAIVAYATGKGIRVVVEPWEYGGTQDGSSCNSAGCDTGALYRGQLVGSAAVPTAAFADMWSKMATVFKDNALVSYGLINEPNFMSGATWWSAAQAAVTAIRQTGSTQRIFVPGLGYTGASNWTSTSCYGCDTDKTPISNAYGWLNANGKGEPLSDPLSNIAVEVHTYVDSDESGSSTDITSVTAARTQLAVTVNEARAHGYQVYLGEIGFDADVMTDDKPAQPASAAWADFINYVNANSDTLIGYTWWAAGYPAWWNDPGANGGGHFSISPTSYPASGAWSGDTDNMKMIGSAF